MKVKIICNWTHDLEHIKNRIIANYGIDPDIELTTGYDFDYLLVFNGNTYNRGISHKKENTIGIIMEPSWNSCWDRQLDSYCSKIIVHDNNLYNFQNAINSPSIMFSHISEDLTNIIPYKNQNPVKTKKISIIVSKKNEGTSMYNYRINLVNAILLSDIDIDIYGTGWNINDSRFKGCIANKKDALLDYEYSIAIENVREHNYITEKYIDCVLCNTIPVYFGAPNINEVYSSHINIYYDIQNTLDVIRKINSNHYQYTDGLVIRDKHTYFENYNIYKLIKTIYQ